VEEYATSALRLVLCCADPQRSEAGLWRLRMSWILEDNTLMNRSLQLMGRSGTKRTEFMNELRTMRYQLATYRQKKGSASTTFSRNAELTRPSDLQSTGFYMYFEVLATRWVWAAKSAWAA